MGQTFKNIKIGLDEDLKEKLSLLDPNFFDYRILKKSVDARTKTDVHFVYTIETFKENEKAYIDEYKLEKTKYTESPVVIVGAGPAGLFAALRLLERGIDCIVVEMGSTAQNRMKDITNHWRYGKLNPKSNTCFGEGGAGLFSDGKLITRIKSPYIKYCLNQLVKFGAPAEIEFLSNPHVGSDKIRRIIPKVREHIIELGGKFLFDTEITDIKFDSNNYVTGVELNHKDHMNCQRVILATGHSSNDIYKMVQKKEISHKGKSFAVGFRIEHPQEKINKIQYKDYFEHPKLGAANYKLTHHNKKTNIGVYSFCMCPGGYVLNSTTEDGHTVCNGMSNYRRNAPFANSAVVVTIDHNQMFDNPFGGLTFRDSIEKKSFNLVKEKGGNQQLPAQYLKDYMSNKPSKEIFKNSSLSGAMSVNLNAVLDDNINSSLNSAFEQFNNKMRGFVSEDALLFGVESRTSSPIQITRDKETMESLSHRGLFPVGEGAGYAGGITSAACDGIRAAEVIFNSVSSRSLTVN